MRRIKTLGWIVVAVIAAAMQPLVVRAADKSADTSALEARVKALEKKLDMEEKGAAEEDQSVRQRIEAIEKDVKTQEQTIADKLGINFHAFVDALYLYNFNNPQNQTNQQRVFDVDSNSFSLQQANINISRKKEDENLGFVINLDFGREAEILHNGTNWSNNPPSTTNPSNVPFELREAYITYKLPFDFLNNVTIKAGKFVTLLGEEVINNYDNFNYNVSRSFIFGFGIPFTNTGLLVDFPIGSMVTIDAAVVNGWDDPVDNNSGKSFMMGVGFTPVDWYNFYFSGIVGPEQPQNGNSKTGTFTWVHTLKATDDLTFVAEALYGNETNAFGQSTPNTQWYGGSGYAVYKFTDRLQGAFRTEVFDDNGGTVNGVTTTRFPITPNNPHPALGGQTAWEVTPTLAYQVTQGLTWRNEYRHDQSNAEVFEKSNGTFRKGQDTLTTELIYVF